MKLEIFGEPYGQGSMRSYAARNKSGVYTGKVGTRPDSPGLPAWRSAVQTEAARVRVAERISPLDGPLIITVEFRFSRPRSHYRTGKFANILRDDAPVWPSDGKAARDIDKLLRAICDGLKAGGLIVDDKLFCMAAVIRLYCTEEQTPGAVIHVSRAPAHAPSFTLSSIADRGFRPEVVAP